MSDTMQIATDDEEEVHVASGGAEAAEETTPSKATPSKASAGPSPKRRRTAAPKAQKATSMEELAARIKKLQDEADQAEAAVKEMEAAIGAKREEAKAKRQEAQKVASEFVKKQCEAELTKLEAAVPKRISNPYFLFSAEERQSSEFAGLNGSAINKRISQKWASLSEESKKEYKDKFEVENKKWADWGNSEGGKTILEERNAIIKQCKAAQVEQLAEAMGPSDESSATPSVDARSFETPTKKRRTSSGAAAAPLQQAEPILDEKVVAEAEQADLLAQLKNLASRPDVQALKKSSQEIWEALRAHSGMVNAAKRALLG